MESVITALLMAFGLIMAVICLYLVIMLKNMPSVLPDNQRSQPEVYYDPYEEAMADPKPERIETIRMV